MTIIKPISDLRNKSNEISQLTKVSDAPVFITKNGEGDMVVMSIGYYTKLQLKIDLLSKLSVSERQKSSGDNCSGLTQVMKRIRKQLNGTKQL